MMYALSECRDILFPAIKFLFLRLYLLNGRKKQFLNSSFGLQLTSVYNSNESCLTNVLGELNLVCDDRVMSKKDSQLVHYLLFVF